MHARCEGGLGGVGALPAVSCGCARCRMLCASIDPIWGNDASANRCNSSSDQGIAGLQERAGQSHSRSKRLISVVHQGSFVLHDSEFQSQWCSKRARTSGVSGTGQWRLRTCQSHCAAKRSSSASDQGSEALRVSARKFQ